VASLGPQALLGIEKSVDGECSLQADGVPVIAGLASFGFDDEERKEQRLPIG
jgi:hypothetical protein